MKTIKVTVIMSLALLLSVGVFAQRGRGSYNNHYRPYNNYNYNRNHFSVTVGPRYGYRPSYRPYYRPAPVYRPAYRPYYRSPRAYVHYGPSFGFRLNVLPFGYSRVNVGSNPYYYNDGVYYRNDNNSSSYEVVAPPLDAIVNKLPSNVTVTMIDGQKYYQVGGTFYQEEFDENNRISYRVVGTDGVINTMTNDANAVPDEDLNAYEEIAPTPIPAPVIVPILGSRYDELPGDSKVQVINQQKYFISPSGIYYKEVIEGDKIRYEVTTVD